MMDFTHPLYRFHYCPHCGGSNFLEQGVISRSCADCGFTYFSNPKGSTAIFIFNARGELLCGRRAKDPSKGTLDLVGGFIDFDETAEEGACREIREEAGLSVRPSEFRYLFSLPNRYLYSGITVRTIDLFFEVHLPDCPDLSGRDDISNLLWLPLTEVKPEAFGLDSVRQAVQQYLDTHR